MSVTPVWGGMTGETGGSKKLIGHLGYSHKKLVGFLISLLFSMFNPWNFDKLTF